MFDETFGLDVLVVFGLDPSAPQPCPVAVTFRMVGDMAQPLCQRLHVALRREKMIEIRPDYLRNVTVQSADDGHAGCEHFDDTDRRAAFRVPIGCRDTRMKKNVVSMSLEQCFFVREKTR